MLIEVNQVGKICNKCKIEKEVSCFSKKLGRTSSICKSCSIIWQKEYRKQFPEKITLMRIKQRCNNLNSQDYPRYGGRGIKCLITAQEIKFLMERDNYWDLKQPSIDRIDNDGHYELSNCRFIEMQLNGIKAHIKSVLQYDLKGNFIKEWESVKDAEITLKLFHVDSAANKIRKTAGGFIWRYKE